MVRYFLPGKNSFDAYSYRRQLHYRAHFSIDRDKRKISGYERSAMFARRETIRETEKKKKYILDVTIWRRRRGCEKNNGKAITIFRESWGDGVAVIAQVRMGRSSAPQLRARPLQIKS